MFRESVARTTRQSHCKSRNSGRTCWWPGSTAGAATSNRPKPYSAFSKICQKVPIVFVVIPAVPGGGTGTHRPQEQARLGDRASRDPNRWAEDERLSRVGRSA